MYAEKRPPLGTFPGEWTPSESLLLSDSSGVLDQYLSIKDVYSSAMVLSNVLRDSDCDLLINAMKESGQECPVSVFGYADGNERGIKIFAGDLDTKGSVRATAWSPSLASQLWSKMKDHINYRLVYDLTPTDWFGTDSRKEHKGIWAPVGLSPVLRFMKYEAGGQHCAHYDAGYDYGDGRRTLMSVVFYLTEAGVEDGGCTRFIEDGQKRIPAKNRNYGDWTRLTRPEEIVASVRPVRGSALIFDHRLCHDVSLYTGASPRVIIRADIVYKMINP